MTMVMRSVLQDQATIREPCVVRRPCLNTNPPRVAVLPGEGKEDGEEDGSQQYAWVRSGNSIARVPRHVVVSLFCSRSSGVCVVLA